MKFKSLKLPELVKTPEWEGYEYKDVLRFFKGTHWVSEFNNWFHGKTGGVYKGKFYVYGWDYDRFCNTHGIAIG